MRFSTALAVALGPLVLCSLCSAAALAGPGNGVGGGDGFDEIKPLRVVPAQPKAFEDAPVNLNCLNPEVIDYAVFCVSSTEKPLQQLPKAAANEYNKAFRQITCDSPPAAFNGCLQYFSPPKKHELEDIFRIEAQHWPFVEGHYVPRRVSPRQARLASRKVSGLSASKPIKSPISTVNPYSQLEVGSSIHASSSSRGHLPFAVDRRWPTRTISYCHKPKTSAAMITRFWQAMQTIGEHTQLRFRYANCNAPGHKIALTRVRGFGSSYVGCSKQNAVSSFSVEYNSVADVAPSEQALSFDPDILGEGSAMHELLHAVGFGHAHQASDRDLFVKLNQPVNNENDEHWEWCNRNIFEVTNPRNAKYNYASIMHYSQTVGTKCSLTKGDMFLPPVPENAPKDAPAVGIFSGLAQIPRELTSEDQAAVTAAYEKVPLV